MARRNLLGMVMAVVLVTAAWGVKGKVHPLNGATDGAAPYGGLISDNAGNLYGTAIDGGIHNCTGYGDSGCGTVFEFSPHEDGAWTEKVLYEFKGAPDGFEPIGNLILDQAGNLYGTTLDGGNARSGTVFELSPNGDGSWTETIIYNFEDGTDGGFPRSGVIADSAGNLYGTAAEGGYCDLYCGGTVFELSPNGDGHWAESTIYSFQIDPGTYTYPNALVFDSAGDLYGTTSYGGTYSNGAAFQLVRGQDGTWTENVLHSFADGIDGGYPSAGMTFDGDGNLYGETLYGGSFACPKTGCGVIFRLAPQPNGTWEFSLPHTFNGIDGVEGNQPIGGLSWDGKGNLYGTTAIGGDLSCLGLGYGCGTIFELTPGSPEGTAFHVVATFDGQDGSNPLAGVIVDAVGNLYGTAEYGGNLECDAPNGCGVVFMLAP